MSDEFRKIDELARARADRGGEFPKHDMLMVAWITGAAVLGLLNLFAYMILPDPNSALFPALILTALCAGGAALVIRMQQNAWFRRYREAYRDLQGKPPRD